MLALEEYIDKYRNYLKSTSEQELNVPEEYKNEFWNWFKIKAKLSNGNKIIRILPDPQIRISKSACYNNTFRISKAFVKRYIYFEGFAFSKNPEEFLVHAFNTNKYRKVYDFTLGNNTLQYDIYIGVKIPLAFIRKIYLHFGLFEFSQYSVLVPFFLYKMNYENYLEYAILPD